MRSTAAVDGPGLPPPAWPPRDLAAAAPPAAPAGPAAPAAPPAPRVALGLDATRSSGAAFYEAMGRPDLASRYRRRRAAKIAVLSAGGGVAVAGLVLVLGDILITDIGNAIRCTPVGTITPYPWFASSESTSTPTCQRDDISPWPVALIGIGMATAMVGAMLQVDPLTPTERRALQPATGPTSDEEPVRRREAASLELRIGAAPAAHGDGGSLLLRGRF